MKVSVITAVFNGVQTIENCIRNVINQTYKNIEYIIIDGGLIFLKSVKVSIITAVLNNKELIEDCINSVVSQTYPHIEHIIIDGGSRDVILNRHLPYNFHAGGIKITNKLTSLKDGKLDRWQTEGKQDEGSLLFFADISLEVNDYGLSFYQKRRQQLFVIDHTVR